MNYELKLHIIILIKIFVAYNEEKTKYHRSGNFIVRNTAVGLFDGRFR